MSVHFFETWRHVYCLMLGKDLEKVKNILPNGGFWWPWNEVTYHPSQIQVYTPGKTHQHAMKPPRMDRLSECCSPFAPKKNDKKRISCSSHAFSSSVYTLIIHLKITTNHWWLKATFWSPSWKSLELFHKHRCTIPKKCKKCQVKTSLNDSNMFNQIRIPGKNNLRKYHRCLDLFDLGYEWNRISNKSFDHPTTF